MRNIPPDALAKLIATHGTEPITVVMVQWFGNDRWSVYADRDVTWLNEGVSESVRGKIVEISGLDTVVAVSNNTSSQEVEIVLDDVDGSIKAILDSQDVHKRAARVLQWFEGLDREDSILLFDGKISSPVVWSERDRTVRFTVISQLEDKEVGFSAEEGQFPYLPADLVGKAWPMIFGTVQDCPALQVNHAVTGTTLTGVGVLSGQDLYNAYPLYSDGLSTDEGATLSALQLQLQISVTSSAANCCRYAGDEAQYFQYRQQVTQLIQQWQAMGESVRAREQCALEQRQAQIEEANSKGLGPNPIQVLGGEDFPQNVPIVIDINGAQFWGHFEGQEFFVTKRQHLKSEEKAEENSEAKLSAKCSGEGNSEPTRYGVKINVPTSGLCPTGIAMGGGIFYPSEDATDDTKQDDILQQFWADAGATVRLYGDEPITYIVSITPGTVLAVKAYKQYEGGRRLVVVPPELYTVQSVTYGSITAVQLVFDRPLSSIEDQGWSDDVYVTFQATAPTYGPNTVDILIHLIETYTDLDYDETSFDAVRTKLTPFPMNFPILDRRNAVQVLQEIAYQARCALWISCGTFYIKYLPEEPTSDDTVTLSDMDSERGIEIELTPTEDLVTKMVVQWRISWAPGLTDRPKDASEKTMILRHNVARYGVQESEEDWYAYNQPDIIFKAATFWMLRKSQTWKKVRFQTYLNKLNLEPFDCVTFVPTGYVANAAMKTLVEKASYNSDSNTIDFECLVPVRAGTMGQYPYFWPADIEVPWPPTNEADDCGGGGIGMNATGELPVGATDGIGDGVIWVGGPNVVFRPRSDWGDPNPSDVGFVAQTVINPSAYGELDAVSKPTLNLRAYTLAPLKPRPIEPPIETISIDIRKTRVADSANPEEAPRLLADVLALKDERVCLRDGLYVADDERAAEYDFKYDTDGEKFGAGTAWLKQED